MYGSQLKPEREAGLQIRQSLVSFGFRLSMDLLNIGKFRMNLSVFCLGI